MVTTRTAKKQLRSQHARSDERGATMFIVLMIVLILFGVGTYAVSNARYETMTAGHIRARGVAAELSDFGGMVAVTEIQAKSRGYYVMMSGILPDSCDANGGLTPAPCAKIQLPDIERNWTMTGNIVVPATPSAPGSVGRWVTSPAGGPFGAFSVELTDPRDVTALYAGYAAGTVSFSDITLTSTGIYWFDDNGNGIVDFPKEAVTATYATSRGHVVVGPLIKGS